MKRLSIGGAGGISFCACNGDDIAGADDDDGKNLLNEFWKDGNGGGTGHGDGGGGVDDGDVVADADVTGGAMYDNPCDEESKFVVSEADLLVFTGLISMGSNDDNDDSDDDNGGQCAMKTDCDENGVDDCDGDDATDDDIVEYVLWNH